MKLTKQDIARGRDILEDMVNLMEEFSSIVKKSEDPGMVTRFKSYCTGNIIPFLTDNHSWLNKPTVTMYGTLEDLHDEVECTEDNAFKS